MSNLKNKLIKLGSEKPELRKHLKPVLDHLHEGQFMNRDAVAQVTPPDEPFYHAASSAFESSDFPRFSNTMGLKYKLEKGSEIFGSKVIEWVFWPTRNAKVDDEFSLNITFHPDEDEVSTSFGREASGSAKYEMGRTLSTVKNKNRLEVVIGKDLKKLYSEVSGTLN